jgi:hypothetical protein
MADANALPDLGSDTPIRHPPFMGSDTLKESDPMKDPMKESDPIWLNL